MAKVGTDISWKEVTLGCVLPNPGSARANLTGSWRSMQPIWEHTRCVKCGVCEMFCPDMAIHQQQDGYYRCDLDYCKGCGICYRECVTGCIKMVQEEV